MIKELAIQIDAAAINSQAIAQLSGTQEFSELEAYEIQAHSISKRIERGEALIGLKMGFTSKAKMVQMGVHDVIWGRLTSSMLLSNGGELMLNKFIHPRVEPELCFRVSKDIEGEVKRDDVAEYIDGVAAAMEIIDSRYENFKFSLEDVIADNCSSAALVVGEWHDLSFPIDNLGIVMEIDGEQSQIGSSAAILGDPLQSFADATRLAVKYNEKIKKGHLIMAGSATPAVYLKPGNKVSTRVEKLGSVQFTVA